MIQLIAAFLFFGDLAPPIWQCSLFDGSSPKSASQPVAALCPRSPVLRHGRVQVCVILLIAASLFLVSRHFHFGGALSLTVQVPSPRVDQSFSGPCGTVPVLFFLRHGRAQVCVIQLIAAFLFFGDSAPPIGSAFSDRFKSHVRESTSLSVVLAALGLCSSLLRHGQKESTSLSTVLAALCPCSLLRHRRIQVCVILLIAAYLALPICQCSLL